MPSKHLILCYPLLLLPSILPSIRVFSNESVLRIRWPKYWSFSVSPSNKYSGLISFRMDQFDILTVQGSLESSPRPQFKSINSLALSFLYSPTLISMHDYWKDHSFDQMDLFQQSNVSVTAWPLFLFSLEASPNSGSNLLFYFVLFLKNTLFSIGVQPINNVVIVSDEQQRDSATSMCICSPPNSPPIQAAT